MTTKNKKTRVTFRMFLTLAVLLVSLLAILTNPALAAEGDLVWAKSAGSGVAPGFPADSGRAISVHPDGSALVTGWFSGSATFGAGEAQETILESVDSLDFFVAKYNPDGTLAWAKGAGGESIQLAYGISVHPDGSAFVVGYFYDTITFSKDTTLVSVEGSSDVFVAKYNPDGTFAWATSAGGTAQDVGYGISVDTDGSALIAGYFRESATFGAGETHETTLESAGSRDIFVAKYNPDGSLAWAKKAGGTSVDLGWGISVDRDGNALVVGQFRESAVFGAGETHETVLVAAGRQDGFVAKYNPDGSLVWAKNAGTTPFVYWGISVDTEGSAYVTGNILAKYNPDGSLAWSKMTSGRAISVHIDGSILVAGYFRGSRTFGAGEAQETTLISAGRDDVFVAKYNPDGTLAWAKSAGGTDFDQGHGISVDPDGNALVAGYFRYSAIFGEGETEETPLISAGFSDIFVAKYEGPRPTTKAKVSWDKNQFEITAEKPFPIKPDIGMDYSGMAGVSIAGIPVLDTDDVYELALKGKKGDKWEYKDKHPEPGYLKEYKIEWKPARFDWQDKDNYGKLHLHAHSIGDSQTIFCIHSEAAHWPMTVTIGEATIEYDASGEINTSLEYEAQKKKNTHVHFELDFELAAGTEIVVDLEDYDPNPIITSDFYKEAYLKFKVKGIFQDITWDATPETVACVLSFRDEEISALAIVAETIGNDEDWDKFDHKKWEYKNGSGD